MRFAGAWAVALAAAGVAAPLGAQGYFGQNQVQYDRFDWKVIETEHFLVHYYPEEREAALDASRMAERSYARLSRVLQHQFREKKPIVLFASRTDFGQNNVTGDLGEFTGGVTDALRQRNILPFTGDYKSFERVLTHEMVHQFQYDIFARGKAGNGLQNLAQNAPPLWFAEGMAEYLSIGPRHPFTDSWIRDAAVNGQIPTIEQMTVRPDRYFPYRFGESLWQYVGGRWGDEVIGQIMNAVPNIGVERAFKRELGLSLEELSDEWREAMQAKHLPQVATLDRAHKFSQPLLSERRTGGQVFLAPALSPDGKHIAFLSNGSFLRGEVFIDLWLGDARTGKRIKRLVKSTTNPDFEELRLLYSQSAFSPDGRYLAFTGQRKGKDVLYLLDVRRRKTVQRFDLPLEAVLSPTWSPDGERIAFSGNVGGITNLYVVDRSGRNFRQLTNDRHGDLQPSWSPDGRTIAFAYYENGDYTVWSVDNPRLLRKAPYREPSAQPATPLVASAAAAVTPGAAAVTVTDSAGVPRARGSGDFVVRGTDTTTVAATPTEPLAGADSTFRQRSFYRAPDGIRLSDQLPARVREDTSVISVARLLENAELALPDTTRFKDAEYKVRFQPEYVARPSVGYAQRNFGNGVFGGTTIVLSDLLGNHRLAFSGQVNGRLSEAMVYAGYTNLSGRLQYASSISQVPYFFLSGSSYTPSGNTGIEQLDVTRFIIRQASLVGLRPRNRFTRFELGASFSNIDRTRQSIGRQVDYNLGLAGPYQVIGQQNLSSINYVAPFAAYVSDNTLFGYTGPIMGRRFRFQAEPIIGSFRWIEYLGDYRRYDPILFNFLTVATRMTSVVRVGRDELQFPQYIGNANSLMWLRGYDRSNAFSTTCNQAAGSQAGCSATELLGSRAAVASAELRFPLIRRLDLGVLPISLPPLEGLLFAEAGMAWSGGQQLSWSRPDDYDYTRDRYPLRSYGLGLRLNLFNFALVRWDYAIPLDREPEPGQKRKGFWTWSLGPSF